MATIRERHTSSGEIRYQVEIRIKGHPRESATFGRKTDAKRWIQQTETAIRNGKYFSTSAARQHTLAELIDRYIQFELPKKGAQKANQKSQLLWWKEQIGAHLLSNITPALIAECRDKLANENTHQSERRSPSTVNRYLAAISHVFTLAVDEWQWLEESPMRKVKKLKEPRGRVRFLSDEERFLLLDACKQSNSPYLYPIVVLALSTGMRRGEILNLAWKDVDLKQHRVTLHETKNGERRAVPLVGHALGVMKEFARAHHRLDTPLVFPGKNPKRPATIRDSWEHALKVAGLNDFRFHDTRHSAASYLAMNGASLAEIAEVLGHKTLQMVKRYAHLSEAHTAEVVGRMNKRIFGTS